MLTGPVFWACSKNPEEIYRDKLAQFKKGDVRIQDMKEHLLASCALFTASVEFPLFQQNAVAKKIEDGIEILYPFARKINTKSEIKLFDVTQAYTLISDGRTISVYDKTGKKKTRLDPDESKSEIMAISFFRDGVALYREGRVEFFSGIEDENAAWEKKFRPPYSRDFSAYFFRSDKTLGVLAGSAGYYYFSSFDVKGELSVKNIKVSSSRLLFTGDSLLYVSGGADAWRLTDYNIRSGKKKQNDRLSRLKDIFIFEKGFIAEKDSGKWLMKFNDKSIEIPFDINPVVMCRGDLVFQEDGKITVCRVDEFCRKLLELTDLP